MATCETPGAVGSGAPNAFSGANNSLLVSLLVRLTVRAAGAAPFSLQEVKFSRFCPTVTGVQLNTRFETVTGKTLAPPAGVTKVPMTHPFGLPLPSVVWAHAVDE